MLLAVIHLLALVASTAFAAGHSDPGSAHSGAFALHRVLRRQSGSETETPYLPIIVGSATPACQTGCTSVSRTVAQCIANQGGDLNVAMCACSASTLKVVEACATCVIHDASNTQGLTPINAYNSFVNQCISLSLASASALYTQEGITATVASVVSTIEPSATQYVPMGTNTPKVQASSAAAAFRGGLGWILGVVSMVILLA